MPLEQTIFDVLHDWKRISVDRVNNRTNRGLPALEGRLRATLPLKETSRTVNFVLRHICKKNGVGECACWKKIPFPAEEALYSVPMQASANYPQDSLEYMGNCTGKPLDYNPCYNCRTPGISKLDLSLRIFGEVDCNDPEIIRKKKVGDPIKAENVFTRPMQPDVYYQFIVNSFLNGWISLRQMDSMLNQALKLEATNSVLRKFLKRFKFWTSSSSLSQTSEGPSQLAEAIAEEQQKILLRMFGRGVVKIRQFKNLCDDDRTALLESLIATKLPQKMG